MMVCNTSKGFVNLEVTGDGRESQDKWVEREIGAIEQTETKKKRAKKAEKEVSNMIQNL